MSKKPERPILIVGFGSAGRRHLRNLRALGYKNILLFRTGKSTLPDNEIAGIQAERDLKKALGYKPIATIIANPTALHVEAALAAAKAGSNLFIEKPISHNLKGIEQLRRITEKKGLVVQVGFQFRFNQDLIKIKCRLEKKSIGPIVSVRAHWGEYLPGWHPWEDWRKGYSARRDLGGGVLLTLCHPFDYLRWLCGEVTYVSALEGKNGGLGLDVEESADVLLQFKSGAVGNVHLDFWQKPREHDILVVGQKGIIAWKSPEGEVQKNRMFFAEMRHFLSCIEGKEKPLCTLDDGIEALKIVLAAKKSVYKKRLIKI